MSDGASTNDPTDPVNDLVILDGYKRLSKSRIWEFQKSYFEASGMNAWTSGAVPHYITSNPFIADAYARLVLAGLRDWRHAAKSRAESPHLDEHETLYLVEVGAGPGRFAFHFLKAFSALIKRSEFSELRYKYVITDLVSSNVDFCQHHAGLAPFIEQGQLDFATYDASQPQKEIRLRLGGIALNRDSLKNPLVVIANYLFDAVPQDVFYLNNKTLYDAQVSIRSTREMADLTAPDLMNQVQLLYKHVPLDGSPYDDAAFNQILKDYGSRIGSATLLFPITALENIRYFRQISDDRFMLISADKGFHWEEDVIGWGEPPMAIHGGCFSMSLNFHALGRYIENAGGCLLQSSHQYNSLDVAAFMVGVPENLLMETQRAFTDSIERFSPADLFSILQSAENSYENMSAEQLMAWLRLSKWDGYLLLRIFPTLVTHIPGANHILRNELNWIIKHVGNNFYDIEDGQNMPFCLGTLHCALGNYHESLDFLQRSLDQFGPDPRAYYNMALCYEALQQTEMALQCAQKAKAVDEAFEPAPPMIIRLESRLSRESMRL